MKKLIFFIALIIAEIFIFRSVSSEVTKNVDPYTYELPFAKATSHKIVQGYGGLFSHKNVAALDFDLPEGTAVYAARGGEIFRYKDDSDEGGLFAKYEKKANFIIIKHDDGSYGCYWHLQKNGVVVKEGSVVKGQLIGNSGSTGFVLSPHLHFSVKRILNYSMDAYVKTKFQTTNGSIFLENKKEYSRPQ